MSYEASAWAWNKTAPPIAKLLLLYLSDGHTDYCDGKIIWNDLNITAASSFCGASDKKIYRSLYILVALDLVLWNGPAQKVALRIAPKPATKPPLNEFRLKILNRDGMKCRYCGIKISSNTAHLDHIFPKSRGGKYKEENLATSCIPCNYKKGARTPEEAKMNLLPVRGI